MTSFSSSINYKVHDLEACFDIRFAMPSKPHDGATFGWFGFLSEVWASNFPNVAFLRVFKSTLTSGTLLESLFHVSF